MCGIHVSSPGALLFLPLSPPTDEHRSFLSQLFVLSALISEAQTVFIAQTEPSPESQPSRMQFNKSCSSNAVSRPLPSIRM